MRLSGIIKRCRNAVGLALVLMLAVLGLCSCGSANLPAGTGDTKTEIATDTDNNKSDIVLDDGEDPEEEQDEASDIEDEVSDLPDEKGTYDSKDEVALYIRTYSHLPSNYITKKEARALGWEGGSLEQVAPGKCIGGDHFGNYEGLLPEDEDYTECDIDTLGKKSRGAKRLVFTDDGDHIYYTDDHYESFTELQQE